LGGGRSSPSFGIRRFRKEDRKKDMFQLRG
jgi:hypothetical protein